MIMKFLELLFLFSNVNAYLRELEKLNISKTFSRLEKSSVGFLVVSGQKLNRTNKNLHIDICVIRGGLKKLLSSPKLVHMLID